MPEHNQRPDPGGQMSDDQKDIIPIGSRRGQWAWSPNVLFSNARIVCSSYRIGAYLQGALFSPVCRRIERTKVQNELPSDLASAVELTDGSRGKGSSRCAISDTELVVHLLEMLVDRPGTQAKDVGHVARRLAVADP